MKTKLLTLNAFVAWTAQLLFTPLIVSHGAMMAMIAAVPQHHYIGLLHPQGGGMIISLATWFIGPFLLLALLVSAVLYVVACRRDGELRAWCASRRTLVEGPYWLVLVDVVLFIGLPVLGMLIG